MWTDTSVCHPHTSPCGVRRGELQEPGGSYEPRHQESLTVQRESTACHPCPGNVPYTVQVPGRRIFLQAEGSYGTSLLSPGWAPRNLLMVDWLKVRGHILRLSRKGGLDGLERRTGGKSELPVCASRQQERSPDCSKAWLHSLTFLHSGQAQSTKCELGAH